MPEAEDSGSTMARDLASSAAALAGAVIAWELLVIVTDVPAFLLPPPGTVVDVVVSHPRLFLLNTLSSLEKIVAGGLIGMIGGFVLGVMAAYVPLFRRTIYPYLVTARVLPKIAIAPLLLIYLGSGMLTATLFISLIVFFPVVLSTAAGFSHVPETHTELLRSVDAPPVRRFIEHDVPYAMPDIFAGLKQAASLAVIGTVVAEWVVTDSGLGYLVQLGAEKVQTDLMMAAAVIMVLMGLGMYGAVVLAQQFLSWESRSRYR